SFPARLALRLGGLPSGFLLLAPPNLEQSLGLVPALQEDSPRVGLGVFHDADGMRRALPGHEAPSVCERKRLVVVHHLRPPLPAVERLELVPHGRSHRSSRPTLPSMARKFAAPISASI